MAGARPKSVTPSIYKGSEEVFECPCMPCIREGSAIEAINFCTDCCEYFCLGCTKDHVKFGMTASHNIVDRKMADHAGRVKKPPVQLPTERCQEHNGELITSFCRDHDAVVCNSCATMDHRTCNMAYIPKISGNPEAKKAIPRMKAEVSASLNATRAARLHLQKHQTEIDVEMAKHMTTIDATTDRLIAHARGMKKAALADVTNRHQEASAKITSQLAQLDDTEAALERRLKNLDNADTIGHSQQFVDVKLASREATAAKQLEERVKSDVIGNVTSKFVVDESVDGFLGIVKSLGKVTKTSYKAVLKGKYDVKSFFKGDVNTSDIFYACELPGGDILMTDYFNCYIKLLDKSSMYKIAKRFRMPSQPWGLCQTRPGEIAVTLTLDKHIQFVDISGSWKLTASFPVAECCRGIAYNRQTLLVSCGGHPGDLFVYAPERPGFIAIYSLSGTLLKVIQKDLHCRQLFSFPRTIVTTPDDKIHIADEKRGIVTIDRQGNILSIFDKTIKYARGLCVLDKNNLIVSGKDSNNVVQITTNGELVSELLCKDDGIKKPQCLICSCSESTCTLTVTFENSNKIKVFELRS